MNNFQEVPESRFECILCVYNASNALVRLDRKLFHKPLLQSLAGLFKRQPYQQYVEDIDEINQGLDTAIAHYSTCEEDGYPLWAVKGAVEKVFSALCKDAHASLDLLRSYCVLQEDVSSGKQPSSLSQFNAAVNAYDAARDRLSEKISEMRQVLTLQPPAKHMPFDAEDATNRMLLAALAAKKSHVAPSEAGRNQEESVQ